MILIPPIIGVILKWNLIGETLQNPDLVAKANSAILASFAIAFAGKYILEVLEVLEQDQVTFLMNDPGQALRIEEKDSTHIIMPVRLMESYQQEEKQAA
jgi:formate hydrogenlyase subunit 3/multisubunit Na+/H+ antiporter MnhD subunit